VGRPFYQNGFGIRWRAAIQTPTASVGFFGQIPRLAWGSFISSPHLSRNRSNSTARLDIFVIGTDVMDEVSRSQSAIACRLEGQPDEPLQIGVPGRAHRGLERMQSGTRQGEHYRERHRLDRHAGAKECVRKPR